MISTWIALALAAAQPGAESAEELACIIERITPAEASEIADNMIAGDSADTNDGGLLRYLESCADRYAWDDARMERITTLTLGVVGQREFGRRLIANGVDVAAIDGWFDAQSEEFRTRAFFDLDESAQEDAVASLFAGPVSQAQGEAHSALIAGYIASRVIALRAAVDLPLD